MKQNLIEGINLVPFQSRIIDSIPIIGVQHMVINSKSEVSGRVEYFTLDPEWITSSIEDIEYENLIMLIDLVNTRATELQDLSWKIEKEDYRHGMSLKYHYQQSFINSYFNTCINDASIGGLFSVRGPVEAIQKPYRPLKSSDGPTICPQ